LMNKPKKRSISTEKMILLKLLQRYLI